MLCAPNLASVVTHWQPMHSKALCHVAAECSVHFAFGSALLPQSHSTLCLAIRHPSLSICPPSCLNNLWVSSSVESSALREQPPQCCKGQCGVSWLLALLTVGTATDRVHIGSGSHEFFSSSGPKRPAKHSDVPSERACEASSCPWQRLSRWRDITGHITRGQKYKSTRL